MLFVWGICGTNKKKVSEGTIELMRNLHLKKALLLACCHGGGLMSKLGSHLLCIPVQGQLHYLFIFKLEYIGGVFGEILIWIPWAGRKECIPL